MMSTMQLPDVLDSFKELAPYKDAESKEEFHKRLKTATKIIIDNISKDSNILLVTHGGFIRQFIYKYSGNKIGDILNSTCFKCSCDTKAERLIKNISNI